MKINMFLSGLFLICVVLLISGTAGADGVLIIDPEAQPGTIPHRIIQKPVPLSVKYHRVQIDINNRIASTAIDQVFRNSYNADLEGTYIFPLPEEAAITDFALYMDGNRVSGEILDKEQAREIYEDIVRKMKDPGLLEYIGRNMFKARIYPIPAHGETRIELVYEQTIEYDAGIYRYVYPLNTERFSPLPLEEVTISAEVKSAVPIKNIYSPSHEVDKEVKKFRARLGYEAFDVKPDKDFVLYYTVSEEDIGLNLLSYKNQGKDGFFLMMLSPGRLEGRAVPKDIIFVLDTSGSMKGPKIEQAKDAIRYCINGLRDDDRFDIINFATGINAFHNSLVPASEKNIKQALAFVDRLDARGGTNINDALLSSLEKFAGTGRPCMVVFLTDGEPTVGETDMSPILQNVAAANRVQARMFVFGVGNDVNTHLLDRIAEDHRGVSEYIGLHENIEIKVSSFYSKISEPVLSDIKLDFGEIRTAEMYPSVLPDIFKGTQLILLGRYRGEGASTITLTGQVNGKEKKFVYEGSFVIKDTQNEFLPRLWATRKIGYLMSEIRLKGENQELIDEIVRLSTEYGIMTPYTSFLVLEKDSDYERFGIDTGMAPAMKKEGERYKSAMERAAGEEAVSSAMDIIELKGSMVAGGPVLKTVKHIGDKTFYLRDGIWVDSAYRKGRKTVDTKYLSRRYFDLLKKKPELARYFAAAKNIIIVFESKCYRIME